MFASSNGDPDEEPLVTEIVVDSTVGQPNALVHKSSSGSSGPARPQRRASEVAFAGRTNSQPYVLPRRLDDGREADAITYGSVSALAHVSRQIVRPLKALQRAARADGMRNNMRWGDAASLTLRFGLPGSGSCGARSGRRPRRVRGGTTVRDRRYKGGSRQSEPAAACAAATVARRCDRPAVRRTLGVRRDGPRLSGPWMARQP